MPLATETKLARGFETLSSLLHYARQKQGAASGISALQSSILTALARNDSGLRPAEGGHLKTTLDRSLGVDTVTGLAKRLSLSKATVSDAVSTLEKKQLVEKKKHYSDSRRQVLSLTPKGKQLAAKLEGVAPPLVEKLGNLSEDEKSGMWLNLLLLLHGLESHGLAANLKMCLTCRHLSMGAEGEYFCGALQQTLEPADLRLECDVWG